MTYNPMFGSKRREDLWLRECFNAFAAGRGLLPICPHCDRQVTAGQAWDESHVGRPKANGGKSVAVGHRSCNREDGAKVVTPAIAKANAQRRFHLGISGPGLGRHPMQGGRRSQLSRSMRGRVQPRLTLPQRLELMRAARAIVPIITTEV